MGTFGDSEGDGTMTTLTPPTAAELRRRLTVLNAERAAAELVGLSGNREYMADLEDELASERHAYVGTAVTEIAVLRAELSGELWG
ncbi:MAG TPA: hypothetical protein VHF89_14130 [Solirubrobacteraceae bacterium]|nr:hypothetical protein [Solirubrobacteraceae bacterium]